MEVDEVDDSGSGGARESMSTDVTDVSESFRLGRGIGGFVVSVG